MKISRSWYQRVLVLVLIPLVLVSMMVVPASAVSVEGTVTGSFLYSSSGQTSTISFDVPRELMTTGELFLTTSIAPSNAYVQPRMFQSVTSALSGSIGFYVSFFVVFDYEGGSVVNDGSTWAEPSRWSSSYVNANGTTGEVLGGVEAYSYTPTTYSDCPRSVGVNVTGHFTGTQESPIYDL